MNNRSKVTFLDDTYCQLCSSSNNKHLSSFTCEQCHLALCYNCHEKHSHENRGELFDKKRQLLNSFQEHCLRNVNTIFDEIHNDLENLRQESLNYIQQQFQDAQVKFFHNEKFSQQST